MATHTTDTHGQRLTVGEFVRYRGSYTPAYGQLAEITAINPDLTMTLAIAGGAATLNNVRRTSVHATPPEAQP